MWMGDAVGTGGASIVRGASVYTWEGQSYKKNPK